MHVSYSSRDNAKQQLHPSASVVYKTFITDPSASVVYKTFITDLSSGGLPPQCSQSSAAEAQGWSLQVKFSVEQGNRHPPRVHTVKGAERRHDPTKKMRL